MADESSSNTLGPRRSPRGDEMLVMRRLLELACVDPATTGWLDRLEVQDMSDGNMGSLYLHHPSKEARARRFGRIMAELQFTDSDGVEVLVALNVDQDGDPFELDVWKTNFQPLIDLGRARNAHAPDDR